MDIIDQIAIRKFNSMGDFAGNDKTFNYGDWRTWNWLCENGEYMDPEEYKALPKETRKAYLERFMERYRINIGEN